MEKGKTTNSREKIGFVIATICCIIAAVIMALTMKSNVQKPSSYEYVVVEQGDTLWILAEQSNGFGQMDRRDIIADMLAEETLIPGQLVGIPMY